MNRGIKFLMVCLLSAVICFTLDSDVNAAASLKALIVTGQNNHNWQVSSPILKLMLQETGLFKVDIAKSPEHGENMDSFRPNFSGYNVVVLDYNGDLWPDATQKAFVEYVRNGGGVVVYHAADNSFPGWKQYNEITGLGGWRGRNEKWGPYIRWRDGKVVRDMTPGRGGNHGPRHAFLVVNRNTKHPITKGLPEKWMHAEDELYSQLRGPAKNLTILATAYADPAQKGTGENEPILFTIRYGKGRIFHTVLGHAGGGDGSPVALQCGGFIVTFQRGAEWAATGKVTQPVPADFPTATEVRLWNNFRPIKPLPELLASLKTYQFGQSRQALTGLDDYLRRIGNSPQLLSAAEKRFVELLKTNATDAAKQFICRKLSIIGTDDCVPVLDSMLTQKAASAIQPSDMARYALQRIPGKAASEALRDALGKTSGKVKVGIINSLGERADVQSTPLLAGLIHDPDALIADAAVGALGKIADAKATVALAKALGRTKGTLRLVVADAYLKCADKLLAAGKKKAAMSIYNKLYVSSEPVAIRVAALKGRVAASLGRRGRMVVLRAMREKDPQIRAAAIALTRRLRGKRVVRELVKYLGELDARGQVQILAAMADRGDTEAIKAVVKATGSTDIDVRVAAFKAMTVLANASNVDMLARAAATTEGPVQMAARYALYRVDGDKADKKILQSIGSADVPLKIELVKSIGERNMPGSVEALLGTAADNALQVRIESLKVLRKVAAQKDLSKLIGLLVAAKDAGEQAEAENTLAAVARKIPEGPERTKTVLSVLASAKQASVKSSLLRTLGKIGDDSGLDALRKALRDSDEAIRGTAIRVLAGWSNAKPVDDLLEAAKSSSNDTDRAVALRGYIRLVERAGTRSAAEKVEMYKSAMALASSSDDKKKILSGLSNVRIASALSMALRYLGDEALSQEAAAAVINISRRIWQSEPAPTKAALQQVIDKSKNDSLVKQAKELEEKIK